MELVRNCESGQEAWKAPLMSDRNNILEAEGVVPDYEDGIRITGLLILPDT